MDDFFTDIGFFFDFGLREVDYGLIGVPYEYKDEYEYEDEYDEQNRDFQSESNDGSLNQIEEQEDQEPKGMREEEKDPYLQVEEREYFYPEQEEKESREDKKEEEGH